MFWDQKRKKVLQVALFLTLLFAGTVFLVVTDNDEPPSLPQGDACVRQLERLANGLHDGGQDRFGGQRRFEPLPEPGQHRVGLVPLAV